MYYMHRSPTPPGRLCAPFHANPESRRVASPLLGDPLSRKLLCSVPTVLIRVAMRDCELCEKREADRLVGVSSDMDCDVDSWMRLDKEHVHRACGDCAETVIKAEKGREMPILSGKAKEIRDGKVTHISDGDKKVSMREPVNLRQCN